MSPEGTLIAASSAAYRPRRPKQGWCEQDTEEWRAALLSAMNQLAADRKVDWPPAAMGFSGQMHGSVFLDNRGKPLSPAILWNDQRTAGECEEIQRLTRGKITDWTLNPPRTAFTAAKMLWTRRNLPSVWQDIRTLLLPKDYLRYLLSGIPATDVTDASGTLLLDVRNRRWSEEALEALDIPKGILPPVFESVDVPAETNGADAAAAGLPDGVPLAAGAADQAAAALGMGVVSPGDLSVTLGTSGVVYMQTDGVIHDSSGAMHTFCHSLPHTFQLMGGVLSAAGSLAWVRALAGGFAGGAASCPDYDDLMHLASRSPPGARGLVFLPYLTGERSPHDDPDARAAWFGLTARHEASDIVRAVLEGVAFALKDLLTLAMNLGARPSSVRIAGGGSRGALWLRIIASVFGLTIRPVEIADASAVGAAVLAAAAAAKRDAGTIAGAWVKEKEPVEPSADENRLYEELYLRYRALYPAARDEMHRLTAFAGRYYR